MVLEEKFKMVLSPTEINRLKIKTNCSNDEGINIEVDVHGLTCKQAKRFIKNIINLGNTAFLLKIIHGYNHGTAIKEMLSTNFYNSHVIKKYPDQFNKGITYMQLA